MDDTLLIVGASCIALIVIVFLMWRSATGKDWKGLTQKEKRRWRLDEEKRTEKKGKTSS